MRLAHGLLLIGFAGAAAAPASAEGDATTQNVAAPYGAPVEDQRVYTHALFEKAEYRAAGSDSVLRWDGEVWVGTDTNRLWIKSEGDFDRHGDVSDGKREFLYDRPITSFFDLQAGIRYDADSGPSRSWIAFGAEGLAPQFLHLSATVYARDGGRFAANARVFHDALLTQRWILQTQLELNAYSKDDPERGLGSGLSDIDLGLRIRYEVRRKLAPYVGLSYLRLFGQTADYAQAKDRSTSDCSFVIGIRAWY
jgi:copper resistance protein B